MNIYLNIYNHIIVSVMNLMAIIFCVHKYLSVILTCQQMPPQSHIFIIICISLIQFLYTTFTLSLRTLKAILFQFTIHLDTLVLQSVQLLSAIEVS